jgi:DNA repair protein RecN (Recombination protein N)
VAGLYEGETSAHAMFQLAGSLLKPFSHHRDVETIRSRMEEFVYQIDDIMGGIRELERGLSCDPDELARLDERLAKLWALKTKYGKTFEEIREFDQKAHHRLVYLTSLATNMDELSRTCGELEVEVNTLGRSLSEKRRTGAPGLQSAILSELAFLSMEGIRFEIKIMEQEAIDETGGDDIDFLISTNPGESLKPLRKVASGGELSRVMLAIKSVLGGDRGKTMVFDEIDSGIGGRVADMVGRRLKGLGTKSQIICVTHLPQIAAYGDYHYVVEKHQGERTTAAAIRRLSHEERIYEIARMLGGLTVTEKTVARAEEMLRHAQESTN